MMEQNLNQTEILAHEWFMKKMGNVLEQFLNHK